jgi:hypothetical protein
LAFGLLIHYQDISASGAIADAMAHRARAAAGGRPKGPWPSLPVTGATAQNRQRRPLHCCGGAAIGLTWRDLVSGVAIVAIVLAYTAYQERVGFPLLSTAWATSAIELVLAAICAVSAAIDLHTRPQPWPGPVFRRITSALGAIALAAGLFGLAASSAKAVEILVVAMGFLWFTATLWHVLSIGAEQR